LSVIKPDSAAAEGMSKADGLKRAKAAKERKEKLKNPNYVISPLRLSIRYILLLRLQSFTLSNSQQPSA